MLLHHVREPTSFEDLKKHNNHVFLTYREICEARGFLENINNWDLTLEEAAQCRLAVEMRKLFAILKQHVDFQIVNFQIFFPQLREKYKKDITDDILHRFEQTHPGVTYNEFIYNEALIKIED